MNRLTARVVAIDPGKTTGWAIGKGLQSTATGENNSTDFIHGFDAPSDWDRVVIERFDLRQFTTESIETVELIGVIKYICRRRRWPFVFVNANDKVKFIDRARGTASGHAADAEAIRLWDLEYGQWL